MEFRRLSLLIFITKLCFLRSNNVAVQRRMHKCTLHESIQDIEFWRSKPAFGMCFLFTLVYLWNIEILKLLDIAILSRLIDMWTLCLASQALAAKHTIIYTYCSCKSWAVNSGINLYLARLESSLVSIFKSKCLNQQFQSDYMTSF